MTAAGSSVLLLRLAAPLQAWGTGSRFVRRNTDRVPSRSGLIGLLAAAKGYRRTDPLEDLLQLRIGVRVEQAGRVERDFQTARTRDGAESMPLSWRFYLADAVFLAAVEGPSDLLDGLRQALLRPHFPLFLGRRSCPPSGKLVLDLQPGDLNTALATYPWEASRAIRARHRAPTVTLQAVVDCDPGDPAAEAVRDEPVSFDPSHRRYQWRNVKRIRVDGVPNPDHQPASGSTDPHQPMALLDGQG